MKRDFSLIRLILLALESSERATSHPRIEGAIEDEVAFQLELLVEAGLVHYSQAELQFGTTMGLGYRLTWRGFEFLDSIRTPDRWRRVKLVIEKTGSLTFEAIKTVAAQLLLKEIS